MAERPLPAYEGEEPYVFVSYSHEDQDLVYPEIRWLQNHGLNIWYDEGISPGHEWTQELADAIEGSEQFVFFVSPASVASRNCRNEVQLALDEEKSLVSVFLEPTELPGGLRLSLGLAQAIVKYELSEEDYQRKFLRVFSSMPEAALLAPSANATPARRARLRILVGSAIAVAITSIGAWWMTTNGTKETPSIDRSLRVEPFTVSADTEFGSSQASGLTEAVLGHLSEYQELQLVTGDAEPSYVLSGVLSRSNQYDQFRAQIVRFNDGQTIWSQTYLPEDGVQSNSLLIARNVRLEIIIDEECESIKAKASSAEAAKNVCAGLANNYRVNQGKGDDPELQHLYARRAIELDEGLADAYWLLVWGLPNGRAREAANDRGLELEPDHIKLIRQKAILHLDRLNYAAAESDLRRCLELDPLSPWARWFHAGLGEIDIHRGNLAKASQHYERAIRVFDADARIYSEYAVVLRMMGDHAKAIRAADAGLSLSPNGAYALSMLRDKMLSQLALGLMDSAVATANQALTSDDVRDWYRPVFYAYSERVADAREALAALALDSRVQPSRGVVASSQDLPPGMPYNLVFTYTALGDVESAFGWISRSLDQVGPKRFMARHLRSDPLLAPLREDPRWNDVMEELTNIENQFAEVVLYPTLFCTGVPKWEGAHSQIGPPS